MKIKIIRLMALCFALTALNLMAGSDAESKKWIAKMVDVYQKAPLTVDLSANMSMNQGGMSMTAVMEGTMTYADQKHYKMEMDMTAKFSEQGEMKTHILNVSDGTTVWTEMDNPMMGGKQIMKLAIEKAEEFAEQQMGMSGMGSSMDPTKMVEAMEKMLDIKFDSIRDGRVNLTADMTPEAAAMMGQQGQEMGIGKFTMSLDEKNIFPMDMVIYIKDTPMMTMRFHNLKLIKKSDMNMDQFKYTPPEGASVIDLAESMKQMQQQ